VSAPRAPAHLDATPGPSDVRRRRLARAAAGVEGEAALVRPNRRSSFLLGSLDWPRRARHLAVASWAAHLLLLLLLPRFFGGAVLSAHARLSYPLLGRPPSLIRLASGGRAPPASRRGGSGGAVAGGRAAGAAAAWFGALAGRAWRLLLLTALWPLKVRRPLPYHRRPCLRPSAAVAALRARRAFLQPSLTAPNNPSASRSGQQAPPPPQQPPMPCDHAFPLAPHPTPPGYGRMLGALRRGARVHSYGRVQRLAGGRWAGAARRVIRGGAAWLVASGPAGPCLRLSRSCLCATACGDHLISFMLQNGILYGTRKGAPPAHHLRSLGFSKPSPF
jgi:hypothetical protein